VTCPLFLLSSFIAAACTQGHDVVRVLFPPFPLPQGDRGSPPIHFFFPPTHAGRRRGLLFPLFFGVPPGQMRIREAMRPPPFPLFLSFFLPPLFDQDPDVSPGVGSRLLFFSYVVFLFSFSPPLTENELNLFFLLPRNGAIGRCASQRPLPS